MTTEERYAEAAYEAYKTAVGGKSIKGEPLPKYDDMPAGIQAAWMHAAAAVIEFDANNINTAVEVCASAIEQVAKDMRAAFHGANKEGK